ncbi:MAG: hypothetical protein ACSHXK_02460 [Oceanococcus sp.]
MTLWIHTLEGRHFSAGNADHSWMHRLSNELDAICIQSSVAKLSDFFDFTDLNFNRGDEFTAELSSFDDSEEDELEDEDEDDSDTGLGYGIDDMTWFAASEGLETIRALYEAVQSDAFPDLDDREKDDLCEELESCFKRIEGVAARGGKFHLAVVE